MDNESNRGSRFEAEVEKLLQPEPKKNKKPSTHINKDNNNKSFGDKN